MAEDGSKVGYGHPPEHGKVKPGERRNPKGRPRGSKNKKTIAERFINVADEAVSITEGGKSVRRSGSEAAMKLLRALALKGQDARTLERFLDRYQELEQVAASRKTTSYPFTDIDRQVLDEMYRRMKLCEADGNE